jgi:hypothetical protein
VQLKGFIEQAPPPPLQGCAVCTVQGVGEYWLFSSQSRSFGYGCEARGVGVKKKFDIQGSEFVAVTRYTDCKTIYKLNKIRMLFFCGREICNFCKQRYWLQNTVLWDTYTYIKHRIYFLKKFPLLVLFNQPSIVYCTVLYCTFKRHNFTVGKILYKIWAKSHPCAADSAPF